MEFLYVPAVAGEDLPFDVGARLIAAHVSPRLKVTFTRVTEMPVTAGGKFLMHESRVGVG